MTTYRKSTRKAMRVHKQTVITTKNIGTNNKHEYRKPFKQTIKAKDVAPSKVKVFTQEEINALYN